MNKDICVVALSGGVDSAVAAHLLVHQGKTVIGVTALLKPEETELNSPSVLDAKRIACFLNIPHYTVALQSQFQSVVIDYFCKEYMNGRTPNPCPPCNRFIKCEAMMDILQLKLVEENKFDPFCQTLYLATGHYVRVHELNGRCLLRKAVDDRKDQSYFLYQLKQNQLARLITPLGEFTKIWVRDYALANHIPVAEKPESQDACFVNGNYQSFLLKHLGAQSRPGDFVDRKGVVIGQHRGISFYTIGQRKGIGIASQHPLYVAEINVDHNIIVVDTVQGLKQESCTLFHVNWVSMPTPQISFRANVKIRYKSVEINALIQPTSDHSVNIFFDHPADSVTPGQSAVFYDGDILLGGGIIDHKSNRVEP